MMHVRANPFVILDRPGIASFTIDLDPVEAAVLAFVLGRAVNDIRPDCVAHHIVTELREKITTARAESRED